MFAFARRLAWLAAVYGCATALCLFSLTASIQHMAETDPSGLPGTTAVGIKSLMMALSIAGLLGAVGGESGTRPRRRPPD